MGIAEKIFKVMGQRSRSYVYQGVNAKTAEAYIATVWCLDSLASFVIIFIHHKKKQKTE